MNNGLKSKKKVLLSIVFRCGYIYIYMVKLHVANEIFIANKLETERLCSLLASSRILW